MRIAFETEKRRRFIFITMLAMLGALFVSRAALSICMILFLAVTLIHKNSLAQLQNFFKSPLLISTTLLFLLPFVSGLWSDHINEWSHLVRIKLPLLLFPIAFAGSWQFTQKQWGALALFFILLLTAGTIWSFEKYCIDPKAINESYLRAKVFLTPLDNDHVRFSWLVALAALLCLWLFENIQHRMKWFIAFVLLWLVVYLHVLAARTGLFSLYFVLLFYAIWKLAHQEKGSRVIVSMAAA